MKNDSGFTLIELSMVLIIISLITAGIVGGRSLIYNAELKSVSADLTGFQTAINIFIDKYDAMPGDITDADLYWPSCDDTPTDCNGGGNGRVDSTSESLRAWQQLGDSEIIGNTFTGTGNFALDTNVPRAKLNAGAYVITYNSSAIYGKQANHLVLGVINGNSTNNNSILSATDSSTIDKKFDDGNGNSGNFIAQDGADATANDCMTATPAYDLSKTMKACQIVFWLD